ncbi:MAG: PIN domain-containing protein [Pirellulaceae bacterium]
MAIVIDADVIIRGEKGAFDLPVWLDNRPQETYFVASVTIAELWHGIERATGKFRIAREAYLQNLVSRLVILPYVQSTALIHARIWAHLESAGNVIDDYDMIVAATAIEHGYPVATFNLRHFQRVPSLVVIEPTI